MMMIGDLSAGKSDMMANYFKKKSAMEIFTALTTDTIIKENKEIECYNKKIKIDCIDTL